MTKCDKNGDKMGSIWRQNGDKIAIKLRQNDDKNYDPNVDKMTIQITTKWR